MGWKGENEKYVVTRCGDSISWGKVYPKRPSPGGRRRGSVPKASRSQDALGIARRRYIARMSKLLASLEDQPFAGHCPQYLAHPSLHCHHAESAAQTTSERCAF